MKKISYKVELLAFLVWIPIVVSLFKFSSEAKVAAVYAGAGFVFIPVFFLVLELIKPTHRSVSLILSLIQFLIFFAIPIFGLRIYFWNLPFNQIRIFGISPESLHRYSNLSYFLIIAVLTVKIALQWRNKKRQPKG